MPWSINTYSGSLNGEKLHPVSPAHDLPAINENLQTEQRSAQDRLHVKTSNIHRFIHTKALNLSSSDQQCLINYIVLVLHSVQYMILFVAQPIPLPNTHNSSEAAVPDGFLSPPCLYISYCQSGPHPT